MGFKTVDARGLSCPQPVLLTKAALKKIEGDKLRVLVNAAVAKENICRFARNSGFRVEINNIEDEYEIIISED